MSDMSACTLEEEVFYTGKNRMKKKTSKLIGDDKHSIGQIN